MNSAIHKDICIRFEVDGRKFKAVGFLNQGESLVDGDEMLRRVPGAIGEEDTNFLDERVDQDWSRDLFLYYLATARRNPDDPRYVRYFYRFASRCVRDWYDLDYRWGGRVLVVCRDDA